MHKYLVILFLLISYNASSQGLCCKDTGEEPTDTIATLGCDFELISSNTTGGFPSGWEAVIQNNSDGPSDWTLTIVSNLASLVPGYVGFSLVSNTLNGDGTSTIVLQSTAPLAANSSLNISAFIASTIAPPFAPQPAYGLISASFDGCEVIDGCFIATFNPAISCSENDLLVTVNYSSGGTTGSIEVNSSYLPAQTNLPAQGTVQWTIPNHLTSETGWIEFRDTDNEDCIEFIDNVSFETCAVISDLYIEKNVQIDTLFPNDLVVYTLVFGNNGPSAASNVVVEDILPNNLTHQFSMGTGSTVGYNIYSPTINYATMAPGFADTLIFAVSVNDLDNITSDVVIPNTASIDSDSVDEESGNNQSTVDVVITPNYLSCADYTEDIFVLCEPLITGDGLVASDKGCGSIEKVSKAVLPNGVIQYIKAGCGSVVKPGEFHYSNALNSTIDNPLGALPLTGLNEFPCDDNAGNPICYNYMSGGDFLEWKTFTDAAGNINASISMPGLTGVSGAFSDVIVEYANIDSDITNYLIPNANGQSSSTSDMVWHNASQSCEYFYSYQVYTDSGTDVLEINTRPSTQTCCPGTRATNINMPEETLVVNSVYTLRPFRNLGGIGGHAVMMCPDSDGDTCEEFPDYINILSTNNVTVTANADGTYEMQTGFGTTWEVVFETNCGNFTFNGNLGL